MNFISETKEYYKSQIENAASKHEEFNSIYAKTLTKFQEMKLFEAFGEAAPQAVLQFAIIIQLGYVSPVQLVTIITSLFSFSLTSAEIFLMMKTKNKEKREATWRQTFILVIPAMFVVVVPRIFSLSLIVAYAKTYALFFILSCVICNVLRNITHFRRDPAQVLLGAMTNIFAPCLVIDEGKVINSRLAILVHLERH